jgi:hypothetical protein
MFCPGKPLIGRLLMRLDSAARAITLLSIALLLCSSRLRAQAPVITAQPQSVSLAATYSTSLRVTATGTGLNYEWQKDGSAIGAPNSPLLSFGGVHVERLEHLRLYHAPRVRRGGKW